jgi:hypothetical protein
MATPFVVSGGIVGTTTIEARGVRHRIVGYASSHHPGQL